MTCIGDLPCSAKSSTSSPAGARALLQQFLEAHQELLDYKNGLKTIKIDGETLSIAAVTASALYNAEAKLGDSPHIRERVNKSQRALAEKVEAGTSVYGVSTGFGGSAETRTDRHLLLGHALLQHHHIGVLPLDQHNSNRLPLQDPLSAMTMPESWVRGAMLIRINTLIRGHSGVRWELIQKINDLLSANIVPHVPLRGSVSASGDLTPLSYIAGVLVGNPSINAYHGPTKSRILSSSRDALNAQNIVPLSLAAKEHLGIMNGTSFSAAVGALALQEAIHLVILAQVCTAMGTEALCGTRGSYDAFIHQTARPHPGQVEAAQNIFNLLEESKFANVNYDKEVAIDDDQYTLRQDRYPLRTAPQFLGPQLEDLLHAWKAVTIECNSTTDNPLFDWETGKAHHGGNFQAMAVTNAMEKTRLSLHHIGKLLFSQHTELLNPSMNHGLPPSVAATDPSLDYHAKGVDIACAAYVSELGFLANPVSTHIQSAEMHNQAVNSLALISARATITALDVLSMLMASYIYVLCQALDLRAMQSEFLSGIEKIVRDMLGDLFQREELTNTVFRKMTDTFDKTSTMDAEDRMKAVVDSSIPILLSSLSSSQSSIDLDLISRFQHSTSSSFTSLLNNLRSDYLHGKRGLAPASPYLHKTKPIYKFVRVELEVPMHGTENFGGFGKGLGVEDRTIGQNISRIYAAIRDGRVQDVVAGMFE
ncbi:phenylalanine ammonia-lyase [Marasmius fiardii PR-910]|nr:phenylalanine ammonia-lyase [Marasmius fiardii PR-910]